MNSLLYKSAFLFLTDHAGVQMKGSLYTPAFSQMKFTFNVFDPQFILEDFFFLFSVPV